MKQRQRAVAVAGFLTAAVFFSSCSMTEPTYRDVSPEQLASIAASLGTTFEQLYREDRALLKTELTEVLGLKVDAIELPDVVIPDGASPAEIVALMKEEGLVARIEPATTAATGAVLSDGLENPSSKDGWVKGGIAGGIVLLASVLGLRGRKRRRRDAAASPDTKKGAVDAA